MIALGLVSRRHPLPGVFAEYTGDLLYAVAACLGYALVLPTLRTPVLAALAFGTCLVVELSQLVNAPILNTLRENPLGVLVLGQGFKWPDLVAYLLGALGFALVDGWRRRRTQGGA